MGTRLHWHTAAWSLLVGALMALSGVQANEGELGSMSTGNIYLVLEVTRGTSAGFLQTNLDEGEAGYRVDMSYRMLESLRQGGSTTIPLCIVSSTGVAFDIEPLEYRGPTTARPSRFESVIPVEVIIGNNTGQPDHKYKAVPDACNDSSAIPITLRMTREVAGQDTGRIMGKISLLIKTE